MNHNSFMQIALRLAERGLGRVAPNPAVGCVIVKDGVIIGRGWTQDGGRPHAETVALSQAGQAAKDAVVYVTLEPCSHTGKTPPCANALIEAGVKKVVIACRDIDPRVNGQGIQMLKDAGIEIVEDIGRVEAENINRGFFLRLSQNRPLITVKVATSLDGKVATSTGMSQWITGSEARQYGHLLRVRHDAVVTGIQTILKDDPLYTCRLPGLENTTPLRIVMDRSLRFPVDCKLASTAQEKPLWIATENNNQDKIADIEKTGAKVIALPKLTIEALTAYLAEQGITRLLVEAGPVLTAAFIKSGQVDEINWFRAPIVIGEEGLAGIGLLDIDNLSEAYRFKQKTVLTLGADICEVLARE